MTFASLVGACLLVAVAAWGPEGHEATGAIADAFLNANAAKAVSSILNGGTLEKEANWADAVKFQDAYKWSYNLHFIDTASWACKYDPKVDCVNDLCVDAAIQNFTTQVAENHGASYLQSMAEFLGWKFTRSYKPLSPIDAMRFVDHFVGDIHQPMHVSFTSDKGGNDIKGDFSGHHGNLHQVWDSSIIYTRLHTDYKGSAGPWITALVKKAKSDAYKDKVAAWSKCSAASNHGACSAEWAGETAAIACKNGYSNVDGSHIKNNYKLGDEYYKANVNIVEDQIIKGGVRLASILNTIYAEKSVALA